MSRTYRLVCDDCKLAIWIGQANYGNPERQPPVNFYMYTAEPMITQINKFFVAHIEHRLRFLDEERWPDDYREIDNETGEIETPDWMSD